MADGACRIALPDGRFALVDAEDFDRINAHRWHLKRKRDQPGKVYVQRTVRLGSGRSAPKTAVVMHREVVRAQPGTLVDHKNGDGTDNRRENLRVCTNRQNSSNVTHSKNQKAGGYKGVTWNKNANKWEAYIAGGEVKPNGKRRRIYLGLFKDTADAARAYDAAAVEAFGEFASLNFPAPANTDNASEPDVTVAQAVGTR